MKRSLTLLITVLLLGFFVALPSDSATLEQVKREQVQKTLSTTEGQQIKKAVAKYSEMYGMDPLLMHAIILTESGYNRTAKSSCGASGLMQLMPATFRARNVGSNIYAVDDNIHAGIKHFSGLYWRYKGNVYLALAAYNLGGGALDSYGGKIPSHGQRYVNKVFYYKNNVLTGIQL